MKPNFTERIVDATTIQHWVSHGYEGKNIISMNKGNYRNVGMFFAARLTGKVRVRESKHEVVLVEWTLADKERNSLQL